MTKHLSLVAIVVGLSGCFFTYDPETVPLAPAASGLSIGDACGGDGECSSGHCADGHCCDSACTGQCEACDVGGLQGTCLAVTGNPRGARAACTNGGSGCGGSCNGLLTSACDYPTTFCRGQSCSGSTLSVAAYCNSGSCPASGTQPCDPYVCGGTVCKGGCGGDADCTAGNYCAGTSCVPKLVAAATCSAGNQCASGFCSPDGKCCDGACTGTCESCNGVATGAAAGVCAPILAGSRPDPTHTTCTGDATGACAGSCNGTTTTACAYPTTSCRVGSCTAGTQTNPASCAAGTCPALTTTPCTPYVCGATACKGSCTSSTDCDSTHYCNGTSCVAKLPDSSPCITSIQCVNGQCADGVCCNSACGGCRACNVAGSIGTCSNVPVAQDPHGFCSITSCQTTCNGSGSCGTAPVGICNSSGCTTGLPDLFGRPISASATAIAQCNGFTQSCPVPAPPAQNCNLHTCDGVSCNLYCLDNSDCVSGTVCVGGACQGCASDADCDPNYPVCYGSKCGCGGGDPDCVSGFSCGGSTDCTNAGVGSNCSSYLICACVLGDNACNGRGPNCVVQAPNPNLCSCGATNGIACPVGQLCTNATATGVCKIAPGFPCGAHPTDCVGGPTTCVAGFCAKLTTKGSPCAHNSECASDWCDTTWHCF